MKIPVPNMLSIFRILLLPVFGVVFFRYPGNEVNWLPASIFLLSGITDFLDGYIARRFGMITKAGKLLDPIADKLTQLTVIGCLAAKHNYRELWALFIIYLIKELMIAIGGLWFIRKFRAIRMSRWFGRVATTQFYAAIFLVILFPGMPRTMFNVLTILTVIFAIYSLVRYAIDFARIRQIR